MNVILATATGPVEARIQAAANLCRYLIRKRQPFTVRYSHGRTDIRVPENDITKEIVEHCRRVSDDGVLKYEFVVSAPIV